MLGDSQANHVECKSVIFNFTDSPKKNENVGRVRRDDLRPSLRLTFIRYYRDGKILLVKQDKKSMELEIVPYYLGEDFFLLLEKNFPDQKLEWRTNKRITIDVNLKEHNWSVMPWKVFKPIEDILTSKYSFLKQTRDLMERCNLTANSLRSKNAIKELELSILKVAENIYRNESNCDLKIHVFGSRMTGLADQNSDVDMYLEKDDSFYKSASDTEQKEILKLFCNEMESQKDVFQDIESIMSPYNDALYIPILRFNHKTLDLKCDLSFKSGACTLNSRLVKTYLQLDKRIKFVVCGVKLWMKRTGLKFTSYTQIWMVLYMLMQKRFSVVPSLEELRNQMPPEKRTFIVEGFNCAFPEVGDIEWKSTCQLTEEELLREFFAFYGDLSLQNVVLRTSTGSTVRKDDIVEELERAKKRDGFHDAFCVQDPFDFHKNLAKNIRIDSEFTAFVKWCQQTADFL